MNKLLNVLGIVMDKKHLDTVGVVGSIPIAPTISKLNTRAKTQKSSINIAVYLHLRFITNRHIVVIQST